jgi:hypothetical protein
MPKLDDAKRQSIDARLAKHKEIMDKYKGKEYCSQSCRFCNWASNGLTLDEAIAENEKHERTHFEYDEFEANMIGIDEIRDSLHDHECKMELCACKCGCKVGPFCTLIFGPLCSTCMVREGRGDDEHGLPVVKG